MNPSPWLTTEQAADFLHVTAGTLSNWRVSGKGPQFSKRTGRVLYHVEELTEWLRGGLTSSTTKAVS